MKILLTGASGQLGRELQSCLAGLGEITAVDRLPDEEGSVGLDLTHLQEVETLLNRIRPDVVINAAAYTAVDKAENDSRTAFCLNAELPACLARWSKRDNAFLLHYSTDYVFGGESGRPYREADVPGPLGVYGASKLAGEWAVGASLCRHIVLRTSWVYSTHGNNFVLNMLRLARQRSELSIISDQTGCPTWARNLARVSASVLTQALADGANSPRQGIFHYCDNNAVTWYDFANMIFRLAAEQRLLHEIPRLKAIKSTEFPQVARRPSYSVLDTTVIQNTFGIQPQDLEISLRACLEEFQP
ncbi:MAG TPA: dTDP-4-dehydrorhamnose reductase [Xanthomonadales bacterium]|nr:dTDP-4-dehydrorhamnose reductase [Xanthomonadales bacterium]